MHSHEPTANTPDGEGFWSIAMYSVPPRMIRRIEDDLRVRARRLLDSIEPCRPLDFLVDVAAELPMQMICILW